MSERNATAEYRELVDAIGWRTSDVAYALTIDGRVAARWASGVREVPPHVLAWLRTLAAAHRANPLPVGWETMRAELRAKRESETI